MDHPKRVLDLFCGAGGVAMGLHHAWPDANILGVDIAPQPHYPFGFVQGDWRLADFQDYDFIWASPPCQRYTLAQRIRSNDHPDYIPELRARLIESGKPWVIENVPGAPLVNPVELCGNSFGLKTYRHRLFECSFPIESPEHLTHDNPTRKMGRPVRDGEFMHVVGNFSGVARAREAMGIDWMTRDELREAIPPAYSKYIAEQLTSPTRHRNLRLRHD